MIVDDLPDARNIYAAYFESRGFGAITARDGEDAILRAMSAKPDVIIMDLAMPRMDGIAATRRLKQEPRTRDIPIILLTAYAEKAIAEGGLEAGAAVFLTKPCLPEDLEEQVRRLLVPTALPLLETFVAAPESADAPNLAGLLRREPAICTGCIAVKLALTMQGVLAAVHDLGQTLAIEQGMLRCPVCDRTKWVVSLVNVACPAF